jgi:GNAT superfamily N-acetyltransferase
VSVAEIRAAVPDDALAVARVHVRSWQVAYRGLIAQAYLDSLKPEVWAAKYGFQRTGPDRPATLLAVDGKTICGLAMTGRARDLDMRDIPNIGELLAIYVDPQHWDAGVGRLLVAAAREQLRRDGFAEAALWVLEKNVRARRFYGSDGWALDGACRTRTTAGAPLDEVRYRRSLG